MSSKYINYTVEDYKQAFQELDPLPKNYLKILKAHYHAPDRVITMTELAEVVRWQSYKSVNLHYGRMGGLVGEMLGISGAALPDPKLEILVTFVKPSPTAHWQLTMRPEVAAALGQLGWV